MQYCRRRISMNGHTSNTKLKHEPLFISAIYFNKEIVKIITCWGNPVSIVLLSTSQKNVRQSYRMKETNFITSYLCCNVYHEYARTTNTIYTSINHIHQPITPHHDRLPS